MAINLNNDETTISRTHRGLGIGGARQGLDGVLAHHTDDVLMFDVPPAARRRMRHLGESPT
jgi:hypothetical protein